MGKRDREKYKNVQPDEREFEKKVMAESKPMHGSYELLDEEKKK